MNIKNPFNLNIKHYNFMVNVIAILIFTLFVILLIKTIIGIIIPVPVTPTNFDFLLVEFMKLPYAFWVLSGFGIAIGLSIHGFKLIHIETRK